MAAFMLACVIIAAVAGAVLLWNLWKLRDVDYDGPDYPYTDDAGREYRHEYLMAGSVPVPLRRYKEDE